MSIILFGPTGMLGFYVYRVFTDAGIHVICVDRTQYDVMKQSWSDLSHLLSTFPRNGIIINCVGIIPQKSTSPTEYIRINTLFPHKLQQFGTEYGHRLIHISTNCVFRGDGCGNYTEIARRADPAFEQEQLYGVSKLAGEPEDACILRTSIIGEEAFYKKGLLEWVRSNAGKKIPGWMNYSWNGVTCLTCAQFLLHTVQTNALWTGPRHLYSPETISKYDLCSIINEEYQLGIMVCRGQCTTDVNLTLSSVYDVNSSGLLKSSHRGAPIRTQIREQACFPLYPTGEYTSRNTCRICNTSSKLRNVFNFTMPLAGGFISKKTGILNERQYPLTFMFCSNCNTGQVREVILQSHLFESNDTLGYYYYSSTIPTLVNHYSVLAEKLATERPHSILEIGCNDGVLLNQLCAYGVKCIGVDPSNTIDKITDPRIHTYKAYFDDETCSSISSVHGQQDIIVACNCLAHMDDIDIIYNNIKRILAENGTAIIEVHYIKNIVDNLNFDFIYHEHMSYHSITSFVRICQRFGFYLSAVEFTEIHGGSLRVYLQHGTDDALYAPEIQPYLEQETALSINVNNMLSHITVWKKKIIDVFRSQTGPLVGYGASGRTNTILNYCGIQFDYIVDDSKYKIGSYLPISHTPIISREEMLEKQFNTVFILAWPYTTEIIKKNKAYLESGGKFVQILPDIRTYTEDAVDDKGVHPSFG